MFDNVGMQSTAYHPGYSDRVYTSPIEEQAALVALLRARPQGMKYPALTAAVLESGSAVEARESLEPQELFVSVARQAELDEAQRDLALWADQGLAFWTILDDRYPARLREIHQAPPFLFARGRQVDEDVAVSVVGSREASTRGIKMTRGIAEALVALDVTVIAGLAAGIDTAAHESTLACGGRTVAVIGTGINKQYPATNRALHEQIAERGLLISQFWPDAPPQKHTFLMRNATMSGYGIATIVVEAGEYSGARAQARMAVEHGRPVILTDLVLEKTKWAGDLVDRPGVHLARSIDDVVQTVRHLIEWPREMRDALPRLLAV